MLTKAFRLWRLIHISLVLVRHGLDEVLLATHLFRPLYFLSYLSPLVLVPPRPSQALAGAHPRGPH